MGETPPERLAEDYRDGSLPPKLQVSLADFLRLYGHRGVAEIDLGLPRWSEDPTYIMGVLANYLRLHDPQAAPDVQFGRATREAEEMVAELTRRASSKGRLRGALVRFLLGRARELSGLREMPKFCIVLLMARARELLWTVGEELARGRAPAERRGHLLRLRARGVGGPGRRGPPPRGPRPPRRLRAGDGSQARAAPPPLRRYRTDRRDTRCGRGGWCPARHAGFWRGGDTERRV